MADQTHPAHKQEQDNPEHHLHQHGPHNEGHGPERAPERRHGCHEHCHGERNFWAEWRDERHLHGRGEDIQANQALSPRECRRGANFQPDLRHRGRKNTGSRRAALQPWHQGMDTFTPSQPHC